MLVEITGVGIGQDGITIQALNLESVCAWENLFEDVEPTPVEFKFGTDKFSLDVLNDITHRLYQTKDAGSLGNRIQKLEGVRTCLLPERYITAQGGKPTKTAKRKSS